MHNVTECENPWCSACRRTRIAQLERESAERNAAVAEAAEADQAVGEMQSIDQTAGTGRHHESETGGGCRF